LLKDVVTRVAQGNGDKGLLKEMVTRDCSIVVTKVAQGNGDQGLLKEMVT
jgi:hypothetical protein